jgi:hypothetical protein
VGDQKGTDTRYMQAYRNLVKSILPNGGKCDILTIWSTVLQGGKPPKLAKDGRWCE